MAGSDSIILGVVQCELNNSPYENIALLSELIREVSNQGAQVICLPELIEGPYFCKSADDTFFDQAQPLNDHPVVHGFSQIARKNNVVLPVSLFERDGNHFYNTVVIIDADGEVLGSYRKSHIPTGPGYEEKYYFRPGQSGFKVWQTQYGVVGVGICWDQWFPECARAMALMGAEVLLYPTAIGSEPANPQLDTSAPWQRAMIGHAVCNAMPIAAANRIGTEEGQRFYGRSFICDHRGDTVADLGARQNVGLASFSRKELARYRAAFGFFRDRRPELYGDLVKA